MIQCQSCGAQNPDYARECAFCGSSVARPELGQQAARLRDQLLGMSLGAEDFITICFALGVDWRPFTGMADEAGKVEMLVRQVETEGRVAEIEAFLQDFRFPQGYPPLPQPPADNLWLTYVYACQNVESMDQLQSLADQIGITDANQLPGDTIPHKLREALWVAKRANALSHVLDWLRTLRPAERLARPDIRSRRNRLQRPTITPDTDGLGWRRR